MHVKRWGALCWATGCYVMLGYIASEDNPADAPPRKVWQLRGSRRKPRDSSACEAHRGSQIS
eukprot:4419985-Pyramimonas_sp.AAC.1